MVSADSLMIIVLSIWALKVLLIPGTIVVVELPTYKKGWTGLLSMEPGESVTLMQLSRTSLLPNPIINPYFSIPTLTSPVSLARLSLKLCGFPIPTQGFIIHHAWHKSNSFLARLKQTKLALKLWNRNVFSNVQHRIKILKDLIRTCQSEPQTAHTLHKECFLQRDLDELLQREEILWRDKAKARWLAEGDANTHYFHLSSIIHRRYNAINRILDSRNVWLCDRNSVGNSFVDYFLELFDSVHPSYPEDLLALIPTQISPESNARLLVVPFYEEVLHALCNMRNFKSPGPDGFTTNFYKQYWGIVGDAVTTKIQLVFQTRKLKPTLNHTFLALIPKTASANRVDHF